MIGITFNHRTISKILLVGAALLVASPALADGWYGGQYQRGSSDMGVDGAPTCRGVYIIWAGGSPFYVGKSRSIRSRLREHFSGAGSSAVASILNQNATIGWEALCTDSDEQMESQLMQHLGTTSLGNLRIEPDPGY